MIKPTIAADGKRDPLEIEHLLTDEQRRTVSVDEHAAFRDLLAQSPPVDPIDEMVAELREVERGRDQ